MGVTGSASLLGVTAADVLDALDGVVGVCGGRFDGLSSRGGVKAFLGFGGGGMPPFLSALSALGFSTRLSSSNMDTSDSVDGMVVVSGVERVRLMDDWLDGW